jgi:cyclophilin family peptidyl-prolyl cis-trans isomerase
MNVVSNSIFGGFQIMNQMVRIFAAIMMLVALGCGKKNEGVTQMREGKSRPIVAIETSMGTIRVELWNDITPKTVENFIGLATGDKEWKDPRTGAGVSRPFYNGLIFHRVIPDFMIQGGCPKGDGTGGPGYTFADECYDTAHARTIEGKITSEDDALAVYNNILVPYFRSTPKPDADLIAIINECNKTKSGRPIMKNTVEYYQMKTGNKAPLKGQGKLKAEVGYGTICMANSGPDTNGSQFFIVTKKDGCPWLNGKHTVFGKVIEGMDVADRIQNVARGQQDRPVKDVVIQKVYVESGS